MKKTFIEKMFASAALGGLLLAVSSAGCAASSPKGLTPQAGADKSFTVMDVNKDGKITVEEFKAAYPNMSEQAFAIIDRNGDKVIVQEEWVGFMKGHAAQTQEKSSNLNNMPGDPLIPPPGSADLPLMRPPAN